MRLAITRVWLEPITTVVLMPTRDASRSPKVVTSTRWPGR